MKKINKYIRRKTLIYKTGVEYGDYTINHVLGCAHGCKYPCYAYMMARRFGKVHSYEEWIEPALVENTLELLQKEMPKYKDKIHSLHLCFTTDPFMYDYGEVNNMSIEIIKMVNEYGTKCTALTKGILPHTLADLSKDNEYGITLISLDEEYRKKYEPNSALYLDRIESLKYLHDRGCKTWVSIEPYPTPNIIDQNYDEILQSVSFVDKIIFGRLNYNPEVSEYKGFKEYYNNLSKATIAFCNEHGMAYHIKTGTVTESKENKENA